MKFKVSFGPSEIDKISSWERNILKGGTPLMRDLEKYKNARLKARMANLQRVSPTEIQGSESDTGMLKQDNIFAVKTFIKETKSKGCFLAFLILSS